MTKHYEGGYFLHNEPLVRGYGFNAHTANDMSDLSRYTVEATNHIQNTPWQINGFVLDLIQRTVEAGKNLRVKTNGGWDTILMVEKPEDPRHTMQNLPSEVWSALSKDEKKALNGERARKFEAFEEALGTYRATQRIIATAVEMSQFERFYFPHNLDFRLRIYPIPTDLNPQSNDLSKGLLRFAQGTRLGKDGLFWLGVTVASHWGEDKLSMQERFDYASGNDFFKKCEDWVDDPRGNAGWLEADAPFQFLAAAHEWVWAFRSGDPASFLSYIPGNLDGSCNGAQHLSIMARDLVGAEATNCMSIPSRKDLYMEVADRVWRVVERDAAEGNPEALEWVPKLQNKSDRRKVVKRSVMTVPYGVTEYGVADFMIKDKHVEKHQWGAAKYMRDLILSSIDETLSNGRALQRWFQRCAVICAEAGLPLVWDTPAGSKVTQAYRNLVQKRIVTLTGRFTIYEEPQPDEDDEDFINRVGMNIKKAGTSAPPNVVHSCDAAHLQITVCRMHDAGIRNFSMIHDSFGCPMAQVGLMRDILRNSIVEMYADNYLQKWKESVERYSGLEMPEPPELGDFDINEILQSEFFFS